MSEMMNPKVKRMRPPGSITGSAAMPAGPTVGRGDAPQGDDYADMANLSGTEMGHGSEVGTEPVGIDEVISGYPSKDDTISFRPGEQKEESSKKSTKRRKDSY